jgi:pyruvate kinase
VQRLALTWGIQAWKIPPGRTSHELVLAGDRILSREGLAKAGDRMVVIAGTVRQSGLTNSMSIREL